jgi:hypothetical protein
MPVAYPFHRTCRPWIKGSYPDNGKPEYLSDPRYAESPDLYVRSFLLIQEDLKRIFEYVEPCDTNKDCYSFRINEILVRSCIEIESNFRAILKENNYSRGPDKGWNIVDYYNINKTHNLCEFTVDLPFWQGNLSVRTPFVSWKNGSVLPWYQTYNKIKHDRHKYFQGATLETALDVVSGLVCVLSAQFSNCDFQPGPEYLTGWTHPSEFEYAIGGLFRVRFPEWPPSERYDFVWEKVKNEPNPFRTLW